MSIVASVLANLIIAASMALLVRLVGGDWPLTCAVFVVVYTIWAAADHIVKRVGR